MEVKKIYFDMDGVLADFDRGKVELLGLEVKEQGNYTPEEDEALYSGMRKLGHFYDKLELIEGAKELFDRVYEKYGDKCEILSGVPKPYRGIDDARDDKIAWMKRLLSDKIKINLVYRAEKIDYCSGPDCILIDDYSLNTDEWAEAGGTAVLFKDSKSTIDKLIEMGVL